MRRWLATFVLLLVPALVRADGDLPAILQEVGIDQHLDAQVPMDLPFRDEHGQEITLRQCLDGKPAVLVMAYYRCPMLCTQVLNGLVEAMRKIPFDVGDEFRVITVSFDDRETPDLAAAKKATYVESYGRPGAEGGWHFLTGERGPISVLADAVGFRFRYDKRQDQFAHASGVILLTPAGRVSRYFYGIEYSPRDLRLGLVEASAGRIGSPVDRVLLFCFHYDSSVGKYTPAVMNVVRLAGAVTLLALAGALGLAWGREWRRSRRRGGQFVAAAEAEPRNQCVPRLCLGTREEGNDPRAAEFGLGQPLTNEGTA